MQLIQKETRRVGSRHLTRPPRAGGKPTPLDRQCRQASAWLATRILEGRAGCSRATLDKALAFHFETQGSQKRMRLALASGNALGLDTHCTLRIAASCETIHNASLIHDDLQDKQGARRDREALWQRFGPEIAICAGDYLLSRAYSLLAETKHKPGELIIITHQAVARLIRGQCLDLDQRAQSSWGPNRCREIAIAKSADLIALPVDLCLVCAGKTQYRPAVRAIADDLAVGYQAMDDLADQAEDDRMGSPNLVNALARRWDNPVERAQTLARRALQRARDRAGKLPEAVGGGLAELSDGLLKRLSGRTSEGTPS
ncbi:MAG: polyprenyl synthetase family protein [Wenzhouxiangella sp.]